jgi:hypothetical protein
MDIDKANSAQVVPNSPEEAAASRQRELSQPAAWQQQLRAPWEGSYTPLTHDGITSDVFSYLGVREWLFIALVARRWKHLYAHMVATENAACGEPSAHVAFTSRAAAFESAARLKMAVAAGLALESTTGAPASYRDLSREQYLAGRYGRCDALALAHDLGLPWTEQVCLKSKKENPQFNTVAAHSSCSTTLQAKYTSLSHAAIVCPRSTGIYVKRRLLWTAVH